MIASWQLSSPPPAKIEHIDGYVVRWLHVPYSNSMGFGRRLAAFLRFMALATWHACGTPADLVFATSTPLTVVIPGAIASWLRRSPWVLEVRDLWPEVPIAMGELRNPVAKWLARGLARLGYRSASHVITLSIGMRDGVLRCGVDEAHVSVIPNLADLDRFSPDKSDPEQFLDRMPFLRGRPIIMYAGTIGRANGMRYLVRIAAEALASSSDVVFCILGDGAERDALHSLAIELGVLDRNLFVRPPIPKLELPSALGSATVCLSFVIDVPELWNNSANKFFDAMAAGKPIAINHEGWQADLLRSTGAGIVLPPSDPATAWHELSTFISDTERISAAGRSARKVAGERFSRFDLACRFERTLVNVLDRAAP